jgi:hypothetical protein
MSQILFIFIFSFVGSYWNFGASNSGPVLCKYLCQICIRENSGKFCFLANRQIPDALWRGATEILAKKREGFGQVWCDFYVGISSLWLIARTTLSTLTIRVRWRNAHRSEVSSYHHLVMGGLPWPPGYRYYHSQTHLKTIPARGFVLASHHWTPFSHWTSGRMLSSHTRILEVQSV